MTNRLLIGYSSKTGFADSGSKVSRAGLTQRTVVNRLLQTAHSSDAFLKLTTRLVHLAEQAYALRDLNRLEEISAVLMSLPVDDAQHIGLYYRALAINRKGMRDEAESLLVSIADHAPITYRARAIQTLGTNHNDRGQFDEALMFQLEALRVASHEHAQSFLTTLLANLEISHIKSDLGDHRGALAILEGISPIVEIVSKRNPLYFYFYHNELAVELGELGRIAEAKAALQVALASPYAPAYPNWSETRQELETKRTSATRPLVAFNLSPEARTAQLPKTRRRQASVNKLAPERLISIPALYQRSVITIPVTATITFNPVSILERVLASIGSRAPPPFRRTSSRVNQIIAG